MRAGSGYIRTDEYLDAAESLRAAAAFADEARTHPRGWKWLLIAVHASVQAAFVISLSRGSFLSALKPTHARSWLEAHEGKKPWPSELHLDYFVELYAKSKELIVARPPTGRAFSCTPEHDKAMTDLNLLRNGFVHFVPQGWSIQIAGLPQTMLLAVQFARYLLWESGSVVWPTESLSKRALGSAKHLLRALERLVPN